MRKPVKVNRAPRYARPARPSLTLTRLAMGDGRIAEYECMSPDEGTPHRLHLRPGFRTADGDTTITGMTVREILDELSTVPHIKA